MGVVRTIMRTLAVLSVGATIVVPTWAAQAAPARIPFACDEYLVSFVPGDKNHEWVAGNVFHGRDGVATLHDVGASADLGLYCEGTDVVVGNINQNFRTGVGQLWGTFRYELAAFPGSGFDGTFHEKSTSSEEASFAGEGVAKGYGQLEGWQMRISIQELYTGSTRVSGYVFNPGA